MPDWALALVYELSVLIRMSCNSYRFFFFSVFLPSKGSDRLNLIIFTTAVLCGGRKMISCILF